MNRNRWKIIVMAVLFTFLLSGKVLAQEGDEIRLEETGKVTLTSKEAAREGVSSLQVSLRVDSAEGTKVEFIFDKSNAKISEFRYDGEAKQWNLYLAGTEALFAEGSDTLTLGRVTVLDGNGEAAAATVSVVEDSVWYVYGTELRAIDALKLPEPVVINAKEADPSEDDEEDDDIPDQGEGQGTVSTPAPAGNEGQGAVSTPKPAGNEDQGTVSTPKPSGNAGQGVVSTPKPSGNEGQGTVSTPKPAGNAGQGAVSTSKPAGNEGQGTASTPKPAGNEGQGAASGSQGNQSLSPTASPQGSANGTVSSSSSVQPANAESMGKDSGKNAAGVDWGIVLIILAIIFAAVFGVAAAMLIVKVITRRR